ncbi:MAG: hypothetical protein KDA67_02185 [Rhodobacteraceae bacterium]|nr:hypothetical protein [Paracoccaceae bacterium]
MYTDIDSRIRFHDNIEVMEVDFSDLRFANSKEVNLFYDRLEERIAATGKEWWFFLVNLHNFRIEPGAWFAYAHRGKSLNLAYSQGSVRFDSSEETRREILRRAKTEEFDANLFTDRESALQRLKSLPSKRRSMDELVPSFSPDEIARRLTFHTDENIMEVDFSNLTFQHSRDVNDVYDHLENRIGETGRKWYFLVNYNNCRINPEAWIAYARRGKKLNIESGLGSVRYAAGSETEAEIRLRAESQDFRPNIRNTRDEALERIAELKHEAMA